MKGEIWMMVFLMLVAVVETGCTPEQEAPAVRAAKKEVYAAKRRTTLQADFTYNSHVVDWEGHEVVFFSYDVPGARKAAAIHSPNCPCHKEQLDQLITRIGRLNALKGTE